MGENLIKSVFEKSVVYRRHPEVFVFIYRDPETKEELAWIKVSRMMEKSCPKCWSYPPPKSKILKAGDNGINGLISCNNCHNYSVSMQWNKTRFDIIDVQTKFEHRRKGYGRMLIELMKDKCDRLVTYWNESSDDGRGLCLSCGMERMDELLEWRKQK